MKKIIILSVLYCVLFVFIGCSNSDHTYTSQSPITELKVSPNSPITSSSQPGGMLPNIIASGDLAAANAEVSTLKAAVNKYYSDNGNFPTTSSDLIPTYIDKTEAKYYFNSSNGSIIKVEFIPSGWENIVFSLSAQQWVKGYPDNNHLNDQDIP